MRVAGRESGLAGDIGRAKLLLKPFFKLSSSTKHVEEFVLVQFLDENTNRYKTCGTVVDKSA